MNISFNLCRSVAVRNYLQRCNAESIVNLSRMGCDDDFAKMETQLLKEARAMVPCMPLHLYKGQAGRVGIIGGSLDYTGAPYFAAISALKVGCDLSHVLCPREAAPVIKSYSPELIVHPILDAPDALDQVKQWLPRLHVLVIGPGLGRDKKILATVSSIIKYCRDHHSEQKKPLVVDADGLHLVTEDPQVILDYPGGAVLTPNAIEFSRLAKSVLGESWEPTPSPCPERVQSVASALGANIVVVHKGAEDVIAPGAAGAATVRCGTGGSGRRCGGQGDLLSGTLGTFYAWARIKSESGEKLSHHQFLPAVVAAYASCRLTRECNLRAVAKGGRSTLTTDMLQEIHPAFEALFE